MSAAPEGRGELLEPGECPICGARAEDVARRCSRCGADLAGVPPRPSAYSRAAIIWTVVGFAVVYVVVLLAVALEN